MAVICACIPSLRPLVNVAGQRFADAPLIRKSPHSSGSSHSRRIIWESAKSNSRPSAASAGHFSQLEEADDLRPLGHDVSVSGGRVDEVGFRSEGGGGDGMEMPLQGINVRTEVILSTSSSERVYYNDRLF